jgi:hypothetical protein
MRKLLVLALALVVAGCASSSGGSAGHGSGDYPARGEIWVGTGLASFSPETGPKLTGRSDTISVRAGTIAVIGHLPAALPGVADLQVDGQTTYTIVLHTYATPDNEWWFWTSFSADASGFGIHGGATPQPGKHTITLVGGYPTSAELASGSFTLTP